MNNITCRNSTSSKTQKRKHAIVGTPIHSSKGKVIGQVIGNVYVKDMTNAHILDKLASIASDIYSLHEAERAGAEYVEWTNTESGVIYRSSIAKFWSLGKPFNFGFGDQQMLGLAHFEHIRASGETSTHTDAQTYGDSDGTHDEPKPLVYKSRATIGAVYGIGARQLSLFGGRNE